MFFDFIKKGKTKGSQKDSGKENSLVAIGKAISNGDKHVILEIKKCINDTSAYFLENEERFRERGVCEEALDDVRWIALVDILEQNGYVCERDWQDELTDFVYFVEKLKGISSRKLSVDLDWFNEEGDISMWCKTLDEKWARSGNCNCIAAIDIDSDSYVLFPYDSENLGKLSKLADMLGRRIDMAKNM